MQVAAPTENNMRKGVALLVCALVLTGASGKLIDLSHKHGPHTFVSLQAQPYNRSTVFAGDLLPGVYAELGQFVTAEHSGTHMDAPVHFQKGGQTLDDIPLENTIAEGVMIDCSLEASKNNGYQVTVDKILKWEQMNGQIPMEAAVIFSFGWSSKFGNLALYLGSDTGDFSSYIFPSVSAEAGLWLSDNRDTKIIATDTVSPDSLMVDGKTATTLPIHQKYLPDHRIIIENLNGTERLPPTGFRFHAAPVKYVGATEGRFEPMP